MSNVIDENEEVLYCDSCKEGISGNDNVYLLSDSGIDIHLCTDCYSKKVHKTEHVLCIDCKELMVKEIAIIVKGIGFDNYVCPTCHTKRTLLDEYILCVDCQKSIREGNALYHDVSAYCTACFNKTVFNEFKVNDLITLKLMGRRIIIFVNDKGISQCMFLLMNIPIEEVEDEECVNIDEFGKKYSRDMEENRGKYDISIETEFWGHCSNLQAWAENDYNPNMLHSSLAVPLLTILCNEDRKIFDALLYHLDKMWVLYKTEARRTFVFLKYGGIINGARQKHNIEFYELQESVFYRTFAFVFMLDSISRKARKLRDNREERLREKRRYEEWLEEQRIIEEAEKEQKSFQRRRNYWERKIYGSDLANRKWLRKLRNHDVSVESPEIDYPVYLWSKLSHSSHKYPSWTSLEYRYMNTNKRRYRELYKAYMEEGITYFYTLDWMFNFSNGWNGSYYLIRIIARYKDGHFEIRHIVK